MNSGYYQWPAALAPEIPGMSNGTLRGRAYVHVYKAIMANAEAGAAILADYTDLYRRNGKATIYDLIYLAAKYQLSFKFTCEWLNELTHLHPSADYKTLPSGIYDRIMEGRRTWKIPDLLAQARREIEILAQAETMETEQ